MATEGEIGVEKGLGSVCAGYDRWAAVYDHDANPLQALEQSYVRQALGDVRGLRALDLGCGTGRHALWMAEHGAEVTALDFSEGMLDEARRKPSGERVTFLQHDLHERLPIADGMFDLVVSGLVLEHLRALDDFFAEARRVLTVKGRAVISAMHPAMFLRGSQARFTDPETGELTQPGSVAHSVSEFVMSELGAGFKVDDLKEISPDRDFASRFPRAEKYIDWPMLLVMQLSNQPTDLAAAKA